MNDYKAGAWNAMVLEARKNLQTNCPLMEDECLVWAEERIAELEAENAKLGELIQRTIVHTEAGFLVLPREMISEFREAMSDEV